MSIQILSDYGLSLIRKDEIETKEWCSDIYAIHDGHRFDFEFISLRRFNQEARAEIARTGTYAVGRDLIIIENFTYDEIVKAIEFIVRSRTRSG